MKAYFRKAKATKCALSRFVVKLSSVSMYITTSAVGLEFGPVGETDVAMLQWQLITNNLIA